MLFLVLLSISSSYLFLRGWLCGHPSLAPRRRRRAQLLSRHVVSQSHSTRSPSTALMYAAQPNGADSATINPAALNTGTRATGPNFLPSLFEAFHLLCRAVVCAPARARARTLAPRGAGGLADTTHCTGTPNTHTDTRKKRERERKRGRQPPLPVSRPAPLLHHSRASDFRIVLSTS